MININSISHNYQRWKQLGLLHFYFIYLFTVKTIIIWLIQSYEYKDQFLFDIEIFCKILNDVTV